MINSRNLIYTNILDLTQESLADITRLKELGFKANWGLENGLREYWEYADGKSKW